MHPLLAAAQDHATKRRWKYLECRGARKWPGHPEVSISFLHHQLKLEVDESALFSRFDSSVRRAVRKAEQNELTVEFSQSAEAIQTFYELLCLTRQRHGVPPQPLAFFSNIQRHVLAQNQGWIVLARHGEIPVAGAIFFHFRQSVIYKFGASNDAFQHLRGNNLVMWAAIRRYAREGFTTLDFGRTAPENEGLRRFKLGWGTEEHRLDYLRYDSRKSRFIKAHRASTRVLNRVCRAAPRFLSRLIGFLLYKHIAIFSFVFDWPELANNA